MVSLPYWETFQTFWLFVCRVRLLGSLFPYFKSPGRTRVDVKEEKKGNTHVVIYNLRYSPSPSLFTKPTPPHSEKLSGSVGALPRCWTLGFQQSQAPGLPAPNCPERTHGRAARDAAGASGKLPHGPLGAAQGCPSAEAVPQLPQGPSFGGTARQEPLKLR